MKAVLDTNVILSALVFQGETVRVAEAWREGRFKPYASPALVAEYAQVLAYPKFHLGPEHAARLLNEQLLPYIMPAKPYRGAILYPCADPDDDILLRASLGAKADWLVTGDAALLALNGRYRFRIGTPGAFLKAL